MAEFTQQIESQGAPSYVGASQGIRSSGDTSVATLFEGLAEAIKSGVNLVDQHNKDQIEQDVFDMVDAAQAEFGIPEATDLQMDANRKSWATMPQGVQQSMDQLDTLQSAFASGALKESHYWARLNSMVRQLRGKYPGYRAEIDQVVSSITGARPANALRSALMREWAEAAQGTGLSDEDKFVNANLAYIPQDYWDKKGTPSAWGLDQLRADVSYKKRVEQEVTARSSEMTLLDKEDKLGSQDVLRSFNADAIQLVQVNMSDVSNAVGKSYAEASEAIQQFADRHSRGVDIDATEIEQLTGVINNLVREQEAQLNQMYASNSIYTKYLNREQVEAGISSAMRPMRLLQQAMADKDFGLMRSVAASIEAQKMEVYKQQVGDVPQLQRLEVLGNMVSGEVMQIILAQDLEVTGGVLVKVLADATRAGLLLGETTMADSLEEANSKGQGAGLAKSVANWRAELDTALSGDLSPELFLNKARGMFGQDNDRIFLGEMFKNPKSKVDFFSAVASPEFSNKMLQLRDKGHTEAWNLYRGWVGRNFFSLFRQDIEALQDANTSWMSQSRITWNDRESKFDVDLHVMGDTYIQNPFRGNIDRLNQVIQIVRPILESDNERYGGMAIELMDVFNTMGLDLSAGREDHPLTQLHNALANAARRENRRAMGAERGQSGGDE